MFQSKKISKAKLKLKSKPWITKELLKSIRRKNKLYKNVCKNNSINPDKLKEYNKYRNKLTKTITNSKKTYYENMLEGSYKIQQKLGK